MGIEFDAIQNLTQLGQYLKDAREERNISIEEIHKETKILKRYLAAMESGEFSVIPGGDVYIKGFLRNYCTCVGLEPSSVIELYSRLKGDNVEEKSILISSNTEPVQIDVVSNKFSGYSETNYKKIFAIALSGILVIVLLISIRTLMGRHVPEDKVSPAVQEPVPEVTDNFQVEETPQVEEKKVLVEVIEDSSRNTTYVIDDEAIEITMDKIIDRCWISVQRDGEQDFEGILNPGDSKTWKAEESIKIRIGNPAAINLLVNGNDLGRPREGARDFIFQKRT